MASDVDVLVVGNISLTEINKIILNFQNKIDREINPVAMSEKEFTKRKKKKDTFIKNVLKNNIKIK